MGLTLNSPPHTAASPSDHQRSWAISLCTLCAILGALLALSFKTQNQIRQTSLPASNYEALADQYLILKKKAGDDERTIAALQENISRLENSVPSHNKQFQVLTDDLNRAKTLAGLTAVKGPGVTVTLNDSKKRFPDAPLAVQMVGIIHDTDINQIVNELKAAGAEAIAVNDQRLVASSPIRCAGPTIYVNNTPQTPPYVIQAIGDSKTLDTALKLPGGAYDQLQGMDAAMMRIAHADKLVIPAYSGATQPKYAQPVTANAGGEADKN
ncbi:hypothetical protein CCAX7_005310 [Capsulimonas corticalis]|uniref:Uncharacterized protein n=1 Tax=Capsulimonas corticalis TaxID=2219043 RepID=A0A402D3B9_9BACT|nr:DUF881 domain-containing protein [Capsulimonas corticalis]BDI28480.1 hypothetical protein CCAX7_005310 [Capsulimonas corticalis]